MTTTADLPTPDLRAAATAMDEYLAAVRRTPEYHAAIDWTAADECDRILVECPPRPVNAYAEHYADDDPAGDVYRRSEGFPVPLSPDQDHPSGSLQWDQPHDSVSRRVVFVMVFVQVWRSWTAPGHVTGWGVNHVLYPDGRGAVWVGVCNNSARVDVDGEEAQRLWAARMAVPTGGVVTP